MIEKPSKKPLTLSELKQHAMMLLSRRDYGAHEIQQKLASKGDRNDAEEVLVWLQQQNMQSDHRFAEVMLRSKSGRGYGPQRIRQDMQQKRLSSQAILEAFEQFEGDWFELALQTYQKKFRTPLTNDPKDRAKRLRFMLYRGYTGDQISHALEQGHQECTNF